MCPTTNTSRSWRRKPRADLFRDPIRDLDKEEPELLKSIQVGTLFSPETIAVLEGLTQRGQASRSGQLLSPERKAKLIEEIVARASAAAAPPEQAAPAQQALFPTAQELAQPIDADKIARELRDRIEKEVEALVFQIDVPDIRIYAEPKLGLREFSPQPSSDFSAVEQRVRSADLQTGEQETGAVLTPDEIDRPIAYLAGLLFDGMEELDAAEDKEMILRLV